MSSDAGPVAAQPSRLGELLVLLSLVLILAWCVSPGIWRGGDARHAAIAFADAHNLREHGRWLALHHDRLGRWPHEGGHRFVMAMWTARIFDHTPANLDRYFTPGCQDPAWKLAKDKLQRGEDPWPTGNDVTTESTHYCGRAAPHLATARRADEALMADDNEGTWNLRDGTVNVLFGDGDVRTYEYRDLRQQFGVGDLDHARPVPTWGPDSPIPECRKLDN